MDDTAGAVADDDGSGGRGLDAAAGADADLPSGGSPAEWDVAPPALPAPSRVACASGGVGSASDRRG